MITLTRNRRPSRAQSLHDMLFERRGSRVSLRPGRLELLEEACQKGDLKFGDFNLFDYTTTFLGETWAKPLEQLSLVQLAEMRLREAGMDVDSTLFPQITSQLLFSEVRQSFMAEANVFSPLIPTVPSVLKGTEIVPAVTNINPNDMEVVPELEEYPSLGVTEEYFTIAAKAKRGGKIAISKEAVLLTQRGGVGNVVAMKAAAVGKALGQNKEDRNIDVFIGQANANNYIRNGTGTNTYLTGGAYINNQANTPLNDWSDVEQAELLFVNILDPNTSQPLEFDAKHLVVTPWKAHIARRILAASQTRSVENLTTDATFPETTVGPNPLMGAGYQLVTSKRLYRRILAGPEATPANAQAGWWLGAIDEAFAYYEIWPVTVVQRGPDSQDGFNRDIELQFKASEFGVAMSREPRKIVRMEDTAW